MDSARDWRDSFSQLEATRKRKSGKQAADAAVAGILSLEQPIAEAGLILAGQEAKAKPKTKTKTKTKTASAARRTATASRAKAPAKPGAPRAATRDKAKPELSARKTKAAIAAPKRQAAPKSAAPKPVTAKALADALALPLPDLATPLVEPALFAEPVPPAEPVPARPATPIAPLPRKASLAPYRKGGLIEAIGFWLRTTARRTRAKLGASTALAKSVGPANGASEIEQLRAENAQLRRQIDALLALNEAAQFKFQP